ncbi:MAG: flap endonuclease [Oscillospiraceae bacterium]|nr:flap endonuclease [Oscillospiraceae bacterium]
MKNNNQDRLLLIDGHNLLFQMFFGMPSRIINKDGKAIQGTLGFVGALIKIIKMTAPTHLAVLFDKEQQNQRTELLEDYKANRIDYSAVPEEDNPFSQLQDIYHALDYMGIQHQEAVNCETDDVIASYALQYANQAQVVISSFDSDFFQLMNRNVSVLRYRGDNTVICGPEFLQEKYGISPCYYADFKALAGDSADNIKGAEQVGPKTAANLIGQFGNLENIILHAREISRPSIRESILRNTERLRTNYKLIRLDGTAAMPFSLDELRYSYTGISTFDVLRGIHLK